MRQRLIQLWNLRRSPSKPVRVAWYATAVALVALALLVPRLRLGLAVAWGAVNVLYTMAAMGWGVFHPRAIKRVFAVPRRWAIWVTVILVPILYFDAVYLEAALTGADRAMLDQAGLSLPTGQILMLLLMLPFLFLFFLGFGLCGAAVSAFTERQRPPVEQTIRAGAGAWWLWMGIAWLVRFLGEEAVFTWIFRVLILSLPLLTAWTCVLARDPETDPQQRLRRFLHRIGPRLKVRWRIRGVERIFDFRGAALGLLVTLPLLRMATSVLLPLEASALITLIQLHNTVMKEGVNQTLLSNLFPGVRSDNRSIAAPKDDIILLEMDAPIRHQALTPPSEPKSPVSSGATAHPPQGALTSHSEAAIQAEMILKLHAWGVAEIALPLPLLVETEETTQGEWSYLSPPAPEDVGRSQQDLSVLGTAAHAAGNVVLIIPYDRYETRFAQLDAQFGDRLHQFTRRMRAVGSGDLASVGNLRLTAIPLTSARDESAPLLLFAYYRTGGAAYTRQPEPGGLHIAGAHIPTLDPDYALVDFRNAHPGHDFQRIAYSSVLHDEPVFTREGKWVPPAQRFKGKIVFLDSLLPQMRETPVGAMPDREALAYATSTLLSGQGIQVFGDGWEVVLTLLLGALVGAVCNRRTPFEAAWRMGLLAFLVLLGSAAAFVLAGRWLDPVVPVLAMTNSYLLVTQFAFNQERKELEHTHRLLHIVAPEVANELLDASEDEHGLGGDKRRVCVLFADVRNFTGFAETHDPEEVIKTVNAYMTDLTEALIRRRGILDKYTGDGLMALFLINDSPREEVAQAVSTALAMREAAANLSAQRIAQGQTPLNIGIGLHYGEAVVGRVGHPDRWDYTALGHTVVVSARLQSLAGGGEIVISEAVHSVVNGAFRVEAGVPVHVKGLSEPVLPYRVLAPEPESAPTQEAAGPTPATSPS